MKKVNYALVKQLSSVERQRWKNSQYSRLKCVEIVGIPSAVEHDQLEPTACRILHHIGVNISGYKIEACHGLGKNSDRTIAKFSSRKYCEHTMRVKKDLKDLDTTDLDLPAGKRLYINDSLCVLIIESCGIKSRNCGKRKKYFLILLLVVLLG